MSRNSLTGPASRGIILSYLWLIVAVTLLTTAAAGAIVATRPQNFVASSQLVVYPGPRIAATAPDMGTEREVAQSGVVATTAASSLGTSVEAASAGLSVSVPVDANVLRLEYAAPTAERALAGANAFTQAYLTYRNNNKATASAAVISPPRLPDEPNKPNLPLVLGLGLVLGAMLGVGLAFVWDRVRGRLRGAADVSRQTALPVLAQIPTVRQQVPLTPETGAASMAVETFGYLAAHLTTLTTRGKGASVIVTSASPGAGKTTVAAGLAIALAATGKEVVLIEGDVLHPDLHTLFGLSRTPGLTDVLADSSKLESALVPTPFADLHVLPGGSPRPGSSFNAEDLELLIQGLSQHAFVVVDAPTALGSAESALLAGRTQFALLVVDLRRDSRSAAAAAVAALSGVGGNPIGCVTNAPRERWHERAGPGAVGQTAQRTDRKPHPAEVDQPVPAASIEESEHAPK